MRLLARLIAAALLLAAGPAMAADPWWKGAVIYEVYPRSFQDTDGNGVGDLNGITQRLDYLQSLGVDAIWIGPIFPSPGVDFGYDISDYTAIDPLFGTLGDFDVLIAQAKRRGMRVLLDMVLNHTSDQHGWFKESASSRTNPKADWYVWNDGVQATPNAPAAAVHEGRMPPNNWISTFGGTAWQWSPQRRQFYYHEFYREQPDLNWRNPEVDAALQQAMAYWMARGVAGFRLDAVTYLYEDARLRDNPKAPGGGLNIQGDPALIEANTENQPEVLGAVRRMRAWIDRFAGDPVLVGETFAPGIDDLDRWYGGAAQDALHLPMNLDFGETDRRDARLFRRKLKEVDTRVHGGQPLLVFDNHDGRRSIDRYGDGKHDQAIAKVIAALLLTPRATALLYQGEEIGMSTTTPQRREDVRDPIGITGWPTDKGRDGSRTPMQWTSDAQAGFTSAARPWLPVPASAREVNVETQSADPMSLPAWHKALIAMRRARPAMREGHMRFVDRDHPQVLAFARSDRAGCDVVLVAMNLSGTARTVRLGRSAGKRSFVRLLATAAAPATAAAGRNLALQPFGVWIGAARPATGAAACTASGPRGVKP